MSPPVRLVSTLAFAGMLPRLRSVRVSTRHAFSVRTSTWMTRHAQPHRRRFIGASAVTDRRSRAYVLSFVRGSRWSCVVCAFASLLVACVAPTRSTGSARAQDVARRTAEAGGVAGDSSPSVAAAMEMIVGTVAIHGVIQSEQASATSTTSMSRLGDCLVRHVYTLQQRRTDGTWDTIRWETEVHVARVSGEALKVEPFIFSAGEPVSGWCVVVPMVGGIDSVRTSETYDSTVTQKRDRFRICVSRPRAAHQIMKSVKELAQGCADSGSPRAVE